MPEEGSLQVIRSSVLRRVESHLVDVAAADFAREGAKRGGEGNLFFVAEAYLREHQDSALFEQVHDGLAKVAA